MTKTTTKVATVSIIVLTGILCLLLVMIWQIGRSGQTLKTYLQALQDRNEREASYLLVSRLVQKSEPDRTELARAFFTDESMSIALLEDIESFAAQTDVTLKTDGLDKIVDPNNGGFMVFKFIFSGEYNQVQSFIEMFETIPYHSHLTELSLRQTTLNNSDWEGRLVLTVSLQSS